MRLANRWAAIAAFSVVATSAHATALQANFSATITLSGDISFGALTVSTEAYVDDAYFTAPVASLFDQSYHGATMLAETSHDASGSHLTFNASSFQTYLSLSGTFAQALQVGTGGGTISIAYTFDGASPDTGYAAGSVTNSGYIIGTIGDQYSLPLSWSLGSKGDSRLTSDVFSYTLAPGQNVGPKTFYLDIHEGLIDEAPPAAVPEPETWALMGLGLVALVAGAGRKRKARR
ncbi:PEP-CTERM sorting domain-containing protein [Amantichitinum ursilacus]|uniref:PEP-CTERM motif protein n=1 Tax=Amantichitinum ursilacus TaxID=857265 RepID=A0A0N0XLB7_9NEIS|nr:PEP-CTERM sorting domain-containing protein [Amantichitinum ursilacus]KPC55384.1 PEP-CTERM motif protein [Amantichitinum ursilacus]